eukprot:UN34093
MDEETSDTTKLENEKLMKRYPDNKRILDEETSDMTKLENEKLMKRYPEKSKQAVEGDTSDTMKAIERYAGNNMTTDDSTSDTTKVENEKLLKRYREHEYDTTSESNNTETDDLLKRYAKYSKEERPAELQLTSPKSSQINVMETNPFIINKRNKLGLITPAEKSQKP